MADEMDAAEAQCIAGRMLADTEEAGGVSCVLVGDPEDYGRWWVQAFQSRGLIEDGDEDAALAGNGPIVVPKDGSTPYRLSSAHPAREQMKRLNVAEGEV
ncbi:hypothetical protein HDC37_000064 [Microbacterium sp. AK009]|uniref:YrhB domain-containing protein n=1 Tax=Microbacterium sp. AK009 TaxID=2723068 RepID=UPI0015C6F902|nr:YrhB domain-containing protein [Microbacterium sp. AK009]NYF15252.1 hypothetical protein [Microbacterium sp. AK009]